MRNINFLIDNSIFIQFKKKCIDNNQTMTEVLIKFIQEYLQDEKI